jgi:Flp pilus assembly protein TadG
MTRARRTRRAERGSFAILFALALPALLALMALVVDLGHLYLVRSQLQNGGDAAALAGVRDLNGTAARFPVARQSAHDYGILHLANGTALNLDLNLGNADTGDIILGNWNFVARTFTVASAATPPLQVNAVKVFARRTAAEGGSVATFFARIFGVANKDLTTTSIAAGGAPSIACGFPLALPDCNLFDAAGNLRCNATLTFGQATTDNVGFTVMLPPANQAGGSPVSTSTVTCAMARAMSNVSQCPGNCNCASGCNSASVSQGQIGISNGNNLSQNDVTWINAEVAANPQGYFVDVPVLQTGLSAANCNSFNFNQAPYIAGFVKLRITGATNQPNRSVLASVDCTHTSVSPPGGGFFGLPTNDVELVQ